VHITAQPPPHRLQNDLYCVEWDLKLYYSLQRDPGGAQATWPDVVKGD